MGSSGIYTFKYMGGIPHIFVAAADIHTTRSSSRSSEVTLTIFFICPYKKPWRWPGTPHPIHRTTKVVIQVISHINAEMDLFLLKSHSVTNSDRNIFQQFWQNFFKKLDNIAHWVALIVRDNYNVVDSPTHLERENRGWHVFTLRAVSQLSTYGNYVH